MAKMGRGDRCLLQKSKPDHSTIKLKLYVRHSSAVLPVCSRVQLVPFDPLQGKENNNNNNNDDNNKNKTNSIWNTQTLTNCLASNVSRGMSEFIRETVYYSSGSRPSDKGRGGHPDPEIRGGAGLKENSFSALRASAWSKNKGGRAHWVPPLDQPLYYYKWLELALQIFCVLQDRL